jgi:Domain of unknown function (DUF222)
LSVAVSTVVFMGGAGLTLAQRRERILAAREALADGGSWLWEVSSGGGLGDLLGDVDALGVLADALRVAITAEALDRGETSDGPAARTPVGWVAAHAPSTRSGGAGLVVRVAQELTKPVNEPVRSAVATGELPVRAAGVVLAEAERLRPLLADGAEPHVLRGLIDLAVDEGPRACRRLRPALLARYGRDGQLQLEQDQAKRFVSLSQPIEDGTGVVEYRLALDPEGRAVLEAAIGPLSAPQPVEGERDLRSSDRRRGEALLALCRRAVQAGGSVPAIAKTQLFVMTDWDVLSSGVRGAGTTVGGSGRGSLLAPETVRRLACDASVIPVVLGSAGEIVDQGRAVRLFTPAQVRRLWLRDGGCTYPGCSMPPDWTDAHHLVHWADFGPSDLANAALLCERHHTIVHQRRLAGQVVNGPGGEHVDWDLAHGSYDELLARRAAQEPA